MKLKASSYRRNQGFALLMALIAVVILTTIVVDLAFSSRVSANIAAFHRDQLAAEYLAKSGVEVSLLRLELDKVADQVFGKKDANNELQWSMPFAYPSGIAFLGGQLSEQGVTQEAIDKFLKDNDLGGSFQAEIFDEGGKININSVKVVGDDDLNGTYLLLQNLLFDKQLRKIFTDKSPYELINAIVDWVDADNKIRGYGGIEDDFYLQNDPPYRSKNGPFFSLPELKLVEGMTPEIYEKLAQYITVYPYSTAVFSGRNYSTLNINTVSTAVMASIFDRNEVSNPEELAKKIIEARDQTAFTDVKGFLKYLDEAFGVSEKNIPKDIQSMLTVSSDVFRIRSSATVNDTTVEIETVVNRSGKTPEHYVWKVN